jgi:CIC family chloride channel protein
MYRVRRLIDPYRRIIFIAIVVGVISGLGSLLFYEGLKWGTWFFMVYLMGYRIPLEGDSPSAIALWAPPGNIFLLLPIICLGALLSGLLITYLAPEAEGHGTDAAIKAFHADGRIRRRIPFLKAVTAILTISTGGSAGREGPAAQISAGFGSMVADYFHLSPKERRLALTTGIGAGIGTIFKAPLGGAVLAAEILYVRDFEAEAIIPSFLASIIGYSIFGLVEGFDPVFALATVTWNVWQLPLFLVLGVFCALVGLLYISVFYGTRDLFARVFTERNLPPYLKPVSGALLISLIVITLSLVSPDMQMLGLAGIGTGYGFVQLSLYAMVPLVVLLLLPFMKILTTSLTLGSGGSGGVFAPGLTIGAATGGAVGMICHIMAPEIVPLTTVPVFVIVGMIALFGAIANAPIAVLIMVVEMMGNFSLLVPAMAGVGMSYLITGGKSIYREQVQTKAQSEAHRHEYGKRVLEQIQVNEAMIRGDRVLTLTPDDTLLHARSVMEQTGHTGIPVVEDERLLGIVTIGDIRHAAESTGAGLSGPVRDAMTTKLIVVAPADSMENALRLMVISNIHHLPVVDPASPDRLAGFLTRTDIMWIYSRASRLL